jgi:hypothetical protein
VAENCQADEDWYRYDCANLSRPARNVSMNERAKNCDGSGCKNANNEVVDELP